MAGVPTWSAARSGLLGNTGAIDHAAQVNQFLGTHGSTVLYQGVQILTATGIGIFPASDPLSYWSSQLGGGPSSLAGDYDQPFTMSGTKIGRVAVPVLAIGTGADMQISLCPDLSGVPGTPITSIRIPAEWITAFSAVAGAAGPSTSLTLQNSTSPLALAQFNTLGAAGISTVNWASPASSGSGSAGNPSSTVSGNYFLQIGGLNGTTPVGNVFTIGWSGGTMLANAVPQPSLPQVASGSAVAATSDTVVCAGGIITSGGTRTTSVYTAGWNPTTGAIAAWSQQAPLPQALSYCAGAAWNGNVYVVGGTSNGTTPVSTVYWASISNGQLLAWNTALPLPVAIASPFVTAVNGFLIVAGGFTTLFSASTTAVYYAAINDDGSLGTWQTGPNLPAAVGNIGSNLVSTPSGLAIVGGNNGSSYVFATQTLQFGADGPGAWQQIGNGGVADSGAFAVGAGQWRIFTVLATTYEYNDMYATPLISVPLPVSGLTNGATYHLLIQQVGGDDSNYLALPFQGDAFPGNPTFLYRPIGTSTWITSEAAIPVAVFDQSAGGQPWHTWEDSGARITTLAWATTPDLRLLGIAEAVAQPGPVLNSNPTFTTGTAPWTATGGALTRSAVHTQGNLPYSGLLTPSGVAATSSMESEQIAVTQGRSYAGSTWLLSPTGYASVALNINWYDSSHALLSTTSGAVTALAANTWTQYATTGTAPSGAAYGTLTNVETGTPPATALLYASAATIQDTVGSPLAAVSSVGYGGTWPSASAWPPLSISELA